MTWHTTNIFSLPFLTFANLVYVRVYSDTVCSCFGRVMSKTMNLHFFKPMSGDGRSPQSTLMMVILGLADQQEEAKETGKIARLDELGTLM